MIREIVITYDSENPKQVNIGTTDQSGDPWNDIGLVLEGLGVLVNTCINNGKVSHNEQSLEEYLKDYIGKVCNDYQTIRPISQRN